ncbi:MAG: hypothetical protein JST70_04020 [Bacteroidetes bacterium]|nr:hypothetical protein [Bacteroidota bacterium]
MFSAIKNTIVLLLGLTLIFSKAYPKNKSKSRLEELILAVDSNCAVLSAETLDADVDTMYYSDYKFGLRDEIDFNSFSQIVKKSKTIKPSESFIQDSFNRIKVLPKEKINRGYSEASIPVFDEKEQFAILKYNTGYEENRRGGYYLLKKVNNKWIVFEFVIWIT